MSESTSVVENLVHDFVWLPAFLEWVGALVANLSPLIALAGAIYLYYKKAASERAELRRDERRKVYAEYVHQCGLLWNEISSGPENTNISKQTSNLYRYLQELKLIAPKEVYSCALNLRGIYIDFGDHVISLSQAQWLKKTEEQRVVDRHYLAKIVSVSDEMISAMKEDLS